MYDIVELRGVDQNEKKVVLKSGLDLEELEAECDELLKAGLAAEGSLTKLRFAVRCR